MVQSLRDLNVIIKHFKIYPTAFGVLTRKSSDLKLFYKIVSLINKKNI